MKFLDEYRDARIAQQLLAEIERTVRGNWVLMEICGGQTHTIMRYGLDELLPKNIELVHGPGCPVCVTPLETIDKALELAARPEVILVSYGDMLRVPGSSTDLLTVKAQGGDVRMVYSPTDALKIAREIPIEKSSSWPLASKPPPRQMQWLCGRPSKRRSVTSPSLFRMCSYRPAIRALMTSPDCRVNGFIAPGHVCTVMGYEEYESLVQDFQVPIVVGGFEPMDILEAVLMLVRQLESGEAKAENQYVRSVNYQGNLQAQRIVKEVFEIGDQSGAVSARFLRAACASAKSMATTTLPEFSAWPQLAWTSPLNASAPRFCKD